MFGEKELSGQIAIVTGAAEGIGEEIAKTLASEGAKVVIADINLEGAKGVASEIQKMGGLAQAVKTDVTQAQEVDEMVRGVHEAWGRIDLLVNNVGGFQDFPSIVETTEEEWDRVVALNLKSVFLCSRAVVRNMLERKAGRIINIASIAGVTPNPNMTSNFPYGAAKAGVIGLTKHLAKELGPYGITVNAISPSATLTSRIRKLMDPQSLEKISEISPLRQLVEPQDCAKAVLFLASEGARYITGINLNVNAGTFMI